jgi:hypothetical protein
LEHSEDIQPNVEAQAAGLESGASAIETLWPASTRRMVFPGDLIGYDEHIRFLSKWRNYALAGGYGNGVTKEGFLKGEIFQILTTLRCQYPRFYTDMDRLKAAIASKPEWAEWMKALVEEMDAKLEQIRVAEEKRRDKRERKEKAKQLHTAARKAKRERAKERKARAKEAEKQANEVEKQANEAEKKNKNKEAQKTRARLAKKKRAKETQKDNPGSEEKTHYEECK